MNICIFENNKKIILRCARVSFPANNFIYTALEFSFFFIFGTTEMREKGRTVWISV